MNRLIDILFALALIGLIALVFVFVVLPLMLAECLESAKGVSDV